MTNCAVAVGSRCRIVSVNHPCFSSNIGKYVIVARVFDNVVTVYDDKPVTYRINKLGKRVVDYNPSCTQTFYMKEQLSLS
jgi:ribosomal protein L17